MKITRRCTFDAAHRLPSHEGKCRRLHGHHYVVDVTIEGPISPPTAASDEGMVMDFSAIDVILDQFVRRFDHQTLLYFNDPLFIVLQMDEVRELFSTDVQERELADGNQPFGILGMEFVPTAECLAQYFLDMLTEQHVGVTEVTVYETEKSSATARVPGEGDVTPYNLRRQHERDADRRRAEAQL